MSPANGSRLPNLSLSDVAERYVTCPTMRATPIPAVGARPVLVESRDRADAQQRTRRRELAQGRVGLDGGASLELGVGGAGRVGSLKCLHAHIAFALARPGYELGERIVAELEPLWPGVCCTP